MMRFLLGAVTILVLLALAIFFYFKLGLLNTRADVAPPSLEANFAMSFLDASVDRRVEGLKNSLQPTEENLTAGLKLYQRNCADCHGNPGTSRLQLGPFYPPAPQFAQKPTDMTEAQNFYIIKHGIRQTGMPAWGKKLADEQIWQLATFLGHIERLPPVVEKEWKNPRNQQSPSEIPQTGEKGKENE